MGERILTDEGYEVVTVSDGDSALVRLDDVMPDVVIADLVMPKRTGYEICQYVKLSPRHRHVGVILTAAAADTVDEAAVAGLDADGFLRKPFEASKLLDMVRPLIANSMNFELRPPPGPKDLNPVLDDRPFVAVISREQVHAAVTVAVDAALGSMVDEITEKVMLALSSQKK